MVFKKHVLVVLSVVSLFFTSSCRTQESVCDGITDYSVLCEIAKNNGLRIETAGDMLMVINSRAIMTGIYSYTEAIAVLTAIRSVSGYQITADQLKSYILQYASDFPELVLVLPYISHFNGKTPLTEVDAGMICAWVEEQIVQIEELRTTTLPQMKGKEF